MHTCLAYGRPIERVEALTVAGIVPGTRAGGYLTSPHLSAEPIALCRAGARCGSVDAGQVARECDGAASPPVD